MAASLIKLFVSASASAPTATGGTVTTTVDPAVTRYNAVIAIGMIGATETTIPADDFFDDNGDPVAVDSLPSVPTSGYINVYVNGVLQESGLSTLTNQSLVLATILAAVGTPVVLEVADFSSTSSTISVEPTISAPTITITT